MAVQTDLKIFQMGEKLSEISFDESNEKSGGILILTSSRNMRMTLNRTQMNFEGDISLTDVGFTKVETQRECIWGSLYVPNLVDVMGTKYAILFFVNERYIVIVDDYVFSQRIVERIRSRRTHQADTKERFLCNFITEIISRDPQLLVNYEKNLMDLENRIAENRIENFQNKIAPVRSELLVLQGYYAELSDLGREFEEDENDFFNPEERKYFGVITDRADRLMNKSGQLLEYAKQVKDDYQTAITARQNSTMQFLTIISTIFMPLTLITSWYGMNFENMPELKNGYPFVIILSICVIIITLIIFRRKKLL